MEKVLKRPEAAEYLGMSTNALAQLNCRGKGPSLVRIGKRSLRYRVSDLDAWLESRIEEPTRRETEPVA